MVFQWINIRQVPREVLKTAASGLGFQHLPRVLANVNSWKTMFDPYIVVLRNKRKKISWKIHSHKHIQSTLVISKSKGLSYILRDIRTSTYQICRIEGKINRTTTFHKWICNLTPEIRDILKILRKRGKLLHRSNFFSFPQYFVTCC